MKHPGFLRLISALYMLAPRFRLLLASFDLDLVGLQLLGSDQDLALPCGAVHVALVCRAAGRTASLDVPAPRLPLDHRGRARCARAAGRPMGARPTGPTEHAHRDS